MSHKCPVASAHLVLLDRGPLGICNLDTQLNRISVLGFKDMINFLQVELSSLREDEVSDDELDEVVADIDGPDLVAD